MFRPYYRSARHARTKRGSGVGLHIVTKLMEAMGGRAGAQPPVKAASSRSGSPHRDTRRIEAASLPPEFRARRAAFVGERQAIHTQAIRGFICFLGGEAC